MTPELALGIVGLALLDSLNPATIVTVALILTLAPGRAGVIASAAILGAALTVFTVGAVLFLTAGAAADAVDGIVIALRFLAFGAAGIALIVAGVRRFRERPRRPVRLPEWFRPATALPFGVVITAADLPNASLLHRDRTDGDGRDCHRPGASDHRAVHAHLLRAVPGAPRRRPHSTRSHPSGAGRGHRQVRQRNGATLDPIGIALILVGLAVASVPFWI